MSLTFKSLVQKLNAVKDIDGPYSLSIRETHKYVGSARHMDDWTRLGQVGVIASYSREEESYEGGRELKFLWIECDSPPEDIARAIRDVYTCQGCSCEHDCCGCISTTVYGVKQLDECIWACRISWSRNI